MARNDRLLQLDDLVGAEVGVEVRLSPVEENNGTVGSSTSGSWSETPSRVFGPRDSPEPALRLEQWRECHGIVEGQPEGLVSFLSALVVEEVLDDVVPDGEEGAASRVGGSVPAIGTGDTASDRSFCERNVKTSMMDEHATCVPVAPWRAATMETAASRALKAIAEAASRREAEKASALRRSLSKKIGLLYFQVCWVSRLGECATRPDIETLEVDETNEDAFV